jgi:hypothetical protein
LHEEMRLMSCAHMHAGCHDLSECLLLMQVIITVLDVRGDHIPAGLPLHAYGRWFNNLTAGAQDSLIQAVRDASGCAGEMMRVSGGKHLYE